MSPECQFDSNLGNLLMKTLQTQLVLMFEGLVELTVPVCRPGSRRMKESQVHTIRIRYYPLPQQSKQLGEPSSSLHLPHIGLAEPLGLDIPENLANLRQNVLPFALLT